MTRNLSPELLRRLDALAGCQGRWIVDCRKLEGGAGYALRSLDEAAWWPMPIGADDVARSWGGVRWGLSPHKSGTPEDAALYCAHTGWEARLLFSPELLDDDVRLPGGYDAPSIIRSNARVFREDHAKALAAGADGDADGIALDVRYITADMLETLEALESYPLISEDDHSALELELQDAAWDDWAADDFRRELGGRFSDFAPEDVDADDWGESVAEALSSETLLWLIQESGETWSEQCSGLVSEGFWLDVKRAAEALSVASLAEASGLQLLGPDQEWRREPYPWQGAEPSALMAPLPPQP